jgi:hypothetical protein
VIHYIEHLWSAAPVRGLIRSAAIRQAGLVRSDEFRAPLEVFVWLVKILRWGNFRRVAEPLYYRLDHPRSFTNQYFSVSEDRKRAVRTTLFTGLLEATMPLCRIPEERLFFHQFIFDHIVAAWPGKESASWEKILAECLERLRFERNTHLLRQEELPPILRELKRRPDIGVFERSRMRRFIHRIRQRSQMARVIYPKSRIRHLLERLRNKMNRVLLSG